MYSITQLVRDHFFPKSFGSNFCISNPLLFMGGSISASIPFAFLIGRVLSGKCLTSEE